jgi:hypothetical protein
MKLSSYALVSVAALLLLATICVGCCVYADPYRLFGSQDPVKPRIYQQAIMVKTYAMERTRPRTILLGNSRVENGFDPQSKEFSIEQRPVFNAGLAGSDLYMAWRLLQDDVRVSPPKLIILEVDFPDFLGSPAMQNSDSPDEVRLLVRKDGTPNTFSSFQRFRDRISSTLTIDALYDSVLTSLSQNRRYAPTMTPLGFNPLHQYIADVHNIGYYGLFEEKSSDYRRRFMPYLHTTAANSRNSREFDYIAKIIAIARDNHSELILFIPPYHSALLDIFSDAGLRPRFRTWKRELVELTQHEEQRSPKLRIRLVDFSGRNAVTSEPVPPRGDHFTEMHWYWEPGHYKPALGDLVLRRLLHPVPNDEFGQTLNAATIEADW